MLLRKDNLRAAIYARVSSEQQAEAGTINSQIEALTERVKADGLVLEKECSFIDEGYTGATLIRPALERLRDMAATGALDRVYVHSPDRLARKYAYQVLLVDELKRCGVELIFLNNNLGRSPEEDMLLQVQGMVAEYERAKILERSRRGKLHAAHRGRANVLSGAPYGYRYVNCQEGAGEARYEIVFEEARIVRQIHQWVGRDRLSIGGVCRRLQAQGVRSARGKNYWDRASVWGVLKNPAYKGTAAFGKTRIAERNFRLRPQRGQAEQPKRAYSVHDVPREEWLYIPVPPLVEERLYETVQEQLEENRKRSRQSVRGARHLLQGLLACKCCGYAYYGKPISRATARGHKREYAYYRCTGTDAYRFGGERVCHNRQVRTDLLEAAVWHDVRALLRDPQRIAEEYRRRLKNKRNVGDNEQLQSVTNKVKRSIGRLVDAYGDGLLEKSEFEPRILRARERLAKLEGEMKAQAEYEAQQQDECAVLLWQRKEGKKEKASHKTADVLSGEAPNPAAEAHSMDSAIAVLDLIPFFAQMVKKVLAAVWGFGTTHDARSLEAEVLAQAKALAAVVLETCWRLRMKEQGRPKSLPCACGQVKHWKGARPRAVRGVVGELNLDERHLYRCDHCGAEELWGDELRGLSDFTQLAEDYIAVLGKDGTFEQGATTLRRLGICEVAASTVRKVCMRLGALLRAREGHEVAAQYGASGVRAEEKPVGIGVGVDGVMIGRIDEQHRQRGSTAKGPVPGKGKLKHYFHEVKTLVVFEFNAAGETLRKTYQATQVRVEEFRELVALEAQKRGAQRAELLVFLGDGAAWVWKTAEEQFPKAIQVLDWYHAMEHVWAVGRTRFGNKEKELWAWVKARENELWEGRVDAVIAAIRAASQQLGKPLQSLNENQRMNDPRWIAWRNIGYFEENKERMKYPEYRAQGLPIGSGVVESSCKHVVATHCKRAGMRWDEEGAENILALRCQDLNGRWDEIWSKKEAA